MLRIGTDSDQTSQLRWLDIDEKLSEFTSLMKYERELVFQAVRIVQPHYKARETDLYPDRSLVDEDKVPWIVEFSKYDPIEFTHDSVLANAKLGPQARMPIHIESD